MARLLEWTHVTMIDLQRILTEILVIMIMTTAAMNARLPEDHQIENTGTEIEIGTETGREKETGIEIGTEIGTEVMTGTNARGRKRTGKVADIVESQRTNLSCT